MSYIPRIIRGCSLSFILAFVTLFAFDAAYAQSYKVLYSFHGITDGADPGGALLRDKHGNFYGTTERGGLSSLGTVFELTPDGTESILHTFLGNSHHNMDGASPLGGLIEDRAGNLYGTTNSGGSGTACDTESPCCGTVFKIDAEGNESILHYFCSHSNCADGSYPAAPLVMDTSRNLYGTTSSGGSGHGPGCVGGCGTIFKLAPDGTETVLYNFCSVAPCADGRFPQGALIMDSAGDLFGTTEFGGGNGCRPNGGCGTVFRLAPNGTETVLYAFTGGSDGAMPEAALLMVAGNLYGTTAYGGRNGCKPAQPVLDSCGTIFELSPTNGETVLYAFEGQGDGAHPHAGVIADASSNLFGTAVYSGNNTNGTCPKIQFGCGTIFELSPNGSEKVLHTFSKKGGRPYGSLIEDNAGDFYGTAMFGGDYNDGVVFRIINN